MIILPAIDIKDGQCVRLFQGDYAQVTMYDRDPVQVAQRWQTAGASWLHVVDLDGAAIGEPINIELIGRIRAGTTLHIEVGGGMRTLEHIEQVLALGIERVILGTAALKNRQLLKESVRRWGERIAVGLDARNGWVATAGWRETSKVQATDLARELCEIGVSRFIYTDIARDGALSGPNVGALKEMQRAITGNAELDAEQGTDISKEMEEGRFLEGNSSLGSQPSTERAATRAPHTIPQIASPQPYHPRPYASPEHFYSSPTLIASGGVSSMDDLRALAELGVEGAIVGKAIYTGDVDLARAIMEIERAG